MDAIIETNMNSSDVVDDVNALLKLGVGDPYRLEHIKQAYILNSTIWKSDDRYLAQLREKYLVKHRIDQPDIQPEIDGKVESDSENDEELIHCWKCGKKISLEANFCMACGSSIFEVGAESQPVEVQRPSQVKKVTKSIGLKKKWFQNKNQCQHYDIFGSKIELALIKGAKILSNIEFFNKVKH